MLGICINTYAQLDLDFETDRGFYDTPFNLELTVNDPNAIIRYTTNGDAPSPTSGTVYFSYIPINTTSYIRAIAYTSTDTTKILTHTYIFPNDVLNQPNSVAGFPTSGFEFDSTITSHATYAPQLQDALMQVPSISLVMDLDDFNAVHQGSVELPTSVELLFPDGSKGYQAYAGIERAGGSSFNSAKRNLRLSFKSIYGDSKFEYPIFGKDAADDFDQIALRPGFHGCMHLGINSGRAGSNDLADQVIRNYQANMSDDRVALHGAFMHLYINGIYWGVYNPSERGTNAFSESYYGGTKEDWDVIKRKLALDGEITAWNTLNYMVDSLDMSVPANYQAVQEYVEVLQFADYAILNNFAPHSDDHPSGKNSFVSRDRTKNDGFRFWMWDTEPALGHYWTWTVASFGTVPYNNIFLSLLDNDDYRMLVADRLQCHCFNEGALTPSKTIEAYMDVYNSTNIAMIAEAARWVGNLEYEEFINTKDRIVNDYLPNRTTETVQLYKDNGVYPNIDAVQFSQYGGTVAVGSSITLTNPNGIGTIYYTTDGTDPRASGGGISPSAQIYTGSISFSQGVTDVKARVYSGGIWSAMCPPRFYTDQTYSNIIINEIMYHPDSLCTLALTDEEEADYFELFNNGNEAINLADCQFTDGVLYDFPYPSIMQPGDFLILAENAIDFQTVYGFAPFGQYKGGLSNDGERLELVDPFGNIIDSLTYNDKNPWDEDPDGYGTSLELRHPDLDNNDPISWFRSDAPCGTPEQDNDRLCANSATPIVFNEINYNSDNGGFDPGDWVELYNPNNTTVDISGWTFYDNNNEFIMPAGTSIEADEFLVIAENETVFAASFPHLTDDQYLGDFVFGLSNKGERISLFDENKCLSGYVVFNDKLPWDTIPDGNGPSLSLLQTDLDNTLPLSWEASSNINSAYGTPGRPNIPCPESNIVFPSTVCAGFPVNISIDSVYSRMGLNWILFGATPSSSTSNTVDIVWNTPGTYNIQLVSSYFECTKIYTRQVTVLSCNDQPVAINDSFSTTEDIPLNDVISLNDNDPNGDGLVWTTNPIAPPANGSLNINADGTFTYTPDPGFFGNDSFEYEVCDDASYIPPFTFVGQVSSGEDDVEELAADGSINTTSGDLDLMDDSGVIFSAVGIRITNVIIPKNAKITGAYLQFVADENNSQATSLTISAEDTGNTLPIPTTSFALSNKPKVSTTASWANIPDWTAGNTYISDDISQVVQSIINRPDWQSGNAITFIMEGSGTRTPETYEGGAAVAPKLIVNYETPDAPINISLCDQAIANIEVIQGCIDFDVSVFMEGPYDPALGEMTTELNTVRGILPGQTPISNLTQPTPAGQPYNISPWNYSGTEGTGWTNANYTDNMVDWLLVSTRTGIDKNTEVGMAAGILHKNGNVSFPEGCALENIGLDSVYIIIEHRNHMGIMSSQRVEISNNTLIWDFRSSDSYRDATSFGQKQLPTGEWVMFAGDADQSDFPSFDIKGTDKTLWLNNNGIFQQYIVPDFDLNGDVNGGDKVLWFENNGVSSRVPK